MYNLFQNCSTGSAAGGVTNTSNSQASQAVPGSGPTPGLAPAGTNFLFSNNQGGGVVALNTLQPSPQHLPSAFVLPSGHVIPVVSNPQLMGTGQPTPMMTGTGSSNGGPTGPLQLPSQVVPASNAAGTVRPIEFILISYQSCSLADRWGATVDFTTSFLHSSRFSAFRSMMFHSRPVHSLMLSSHRFLCLPLRLPP